MASENNDLYGLSLSLYILIIVIQILLLIFMIIFSIYVMKKCKGSPSWLNPVIITLLVLCLVFCWVPFIGFILFVVLLFILLNYDSICKKVKKN
jgi:hypothetical protein